MSTSLNNFRKELSETVLNFVWQQWSSIGVMAADVSERTRLVDPEPLLLLTLEVARQDPRMFDEVMDWLIVNGRWINVVRLSALFTEDKVCSPEVLGAVAATLAKHDKTPKWRTLANKFKCKRAKEFEPLFEKAGQSLFLAGNEADATFRSYGLLRPSFVTRGMSAPVVPSPLPMWTAANFIFKARALFGVNIRADVFAFLVLQGAANPTRIARDLGYSQRRVQDALADMAAADLFKVRAVGKAKEYFVDSESVLRSLGAAESEVAWFDWRALSRALATIWRRAFSLREVGLTPYVLESEQEKVLREVKNDLLSAGLGRRTESRPGISDPTRSKGLMPSLQSALASSPGYNWKRFWLPREGTISYADGGYPFDPKQDELWSDGTKSDAVDFDSVAHIPCLVLLGEPGMGKSFALRDAIKTLETSLKETREKLLFLDLRSYGSEERLIRDLFESETFRAWSRGEHQLHVFLDSLDEALLHQSTIANLLVDQLQQLASVRGLFFRIACRTAEWPIALESGLKSKWGDENVEVLELVPLTRPDVTEAAEASGIDVDEFFREVDSREAVPLAFKPVTLKFLLSSFQQSGQLSSSQRDIYAEGCRILCEEANETRIGARLAGKLTAEQRMEVAAHIAAATAFCNRSAIWTGTTSGLVPESDLTLDELCVSTVSEQGQPVTREAVLETLGTALFSSRGPDRLGWAHQTYAEFLAAWHLHRRGTSLCQMLNLLIHPGDLERKIVPQLHETAAWLASMKIELFRGLMKSDPDVLLRSDAATASAEDREKLVASLLTQLEENKLLNWEWSLITRYRKLKHPRLVEQLRPYILDHSKNRIVRREAIHIAAVCELKALAGDLALVALDPSEDSSIRAEAAAFVAKADEPTLRVRLKPLLNSSAAEDPADELKGYALQVCWPAWMTVEELFQALTPPKESSLCGAYSEFLSSKFTESFKPSDLGVALRWVRQQPRRESQFFFEARMEDIFDRAVSNLEYPDVLEEFAKTVLHRVRDHSLQQIQHGWREVIRSDATIRHRLLDALLSQMTDPQKDVFDLLCSEVCFVTDTDFPWLIGRLERESSSQIQTAIARLIRNTFKLTEPSHVDAVIRSEEKISSLRTVFSYFLKPVPLDSDEARDLREEHNRQKMLQAKVAKEREKRLLSRPPAESIAMLLERFECRGELDAWWCLLRELTLEPMSTDYEHEHEEKPDITQLPGWASAKPDTRERIVAAGRKYLFERDANPDAWFGKKHVYHPPAAAGFKALVLLHKEAPEEFKRLPRSVWTKWMPIIIHEARALHGAIASAAYRAAPDELIQWFNRTIDLENEQEQGVYLAFPPLEDGVWDDRLGRWLLEKAKTPGLKPRILRPLVEVLLAHDVPGSTELARELIQLPLPSEEQVRKQILNTANALLVHSQDGWSIVWPAMLRYPEFGRVLFENVAYQYLHRPSPVVEKLAPEQVADLYIWLLGQFPPEQDPKKEGAHSVSRREAVAVFRDQLVSRLKDRGTPEAVQAIERLIQQLPSSNWLKWILAQARAAARKKTWRPPNPRELFKLITSNELRLVRDGDELLNVVVESLRRLEKRLQGETAVSEFLWDKVPGTNFWRPKDENAFSNFVKWHLDSDLKSRGIVANREVEIRRGEETDIHVDAVVKERGGGYDRVTVIIEAKGSWNNPELETAIKSQLVDRYLRDNACQHGLYLVGCFNSPKWDEEDYRKKASARFAKEHLGESLSAHAARLSGTGLRVEALVLNTALR